jgi:hypothetical protein
VRKKNRGANGQQISEFAAALVLLFLIFFVPMLDLGIMPVRWFLAREIIANYARKLSLCETYSQALSLLSADPSMETQLIRLGGVKPRNIRCHLIVSSTRTGERFVVGAARTIPGQWLPNGSRAPCDYAMEVAADVDISPVFLISFMGGKVPGLNCPVSFTISSEANWENLGRDPVTKVFFVNE